MIETIELHSQVTPIPGYILCPAGANEKDKGRVSTLPFAKRNEARPRRTVPGYCHPPLRGWSIIKNESSNAWAHQTRPLHCRYLTIRTNLGKCNGAKAST